MKVKHLIVELQKFNPELEVITEGCDCDGDSASVKEVKFVMGKIHKNNSLRIYST